MNSTTAVLPFCAAFLYWSVAVAVPFNRWCRYAYFYPLYGLRACCQKYAVGPSTVINNPMTQRFTDPARKIQAQIPIALLLILTAVAHSAVSSTEASQTPAR